MEAKTSSMSGPLGKKARFDVHPVSSAVPDGMAAPNDSNAQVKMKTKAKQRYLKRKKDKRRKRKDNETNAKPSSATAEVDVEPGSEDEDVSDNVWEEVAQMDQGGETVNGRPRRREEIKPMKKEKQEPKVTKGEEPVTNGKPLKKKRRKEPNPELQEDSDVDVDVPEHLRNSDPPVPPLAENGDAGGQGLSTSPPPSPPLTALPSFTLPPSNVHSDPAALSIQGLPQALLQAASVPASLSIPLELLDSHAGRQDRDLPVLSAKMTKRLKELGIQELFAVQSTLLPFLLPPSRSSRSLYIPHEPPQDACVSAPTGSGKTLAYVVPIVEVLAPRIITRLRALIVLPTRDLVAQVHETCEAVARGRGLKIGIATGQHSFVHEQGQLVGDVAHADTLLGGASRVDVLVCTPGRLIDHLNGTKNFTLQHLRFLVIDEADRLLAQSFHDWLHRVFTAIKPPSGLDAFGFHSKTLSTSPVCDDLSAHTDKVADDTHDDAVPHKLTGSLSNLAPSWLAKYQELELQQRRELANRRLNESRMSRHASTSMHVDDDGDARARSIEDRFLRMHELLEHFSDPVQPSCQKLLFSATLPRDPGTLAELDLRNPRVWVVQGVQGLRRDGATAYQNVEVESGEQGEGAMVEEAGEEAVMKGVVWIQEFAMPSGLKEHMIVASSYEKPVMLFWLLMKLRDQFASKDDEGGGILVFTKSAEATERVVKLFDFFAEAMASRKNVDADASIGGSQDQLPKARAVVVRMYSSDLNPGERRAVLDGFRKRNVDVLVASDLISRGIDIPHVQAVVSYDSPVDMRKYVHRAGRTARAGRGGEAWTIVETQEARYFKSMLRTANHLDRVKKVRVGQAQVGGLMGIYKTALEQLKGVYSRSEPRAL